jgi:hypothetical protein
MIELFTREELQAIRQKAEQNWEAVTDPMWQRAYEDLIFACSTLDAFEARASVPSCACQTRPLDIDNRFDAEIEPS